MRSSSANSPRARSARSRGSSSPRACHSRRLAQHPAQVAAGVRGVGDVGDAVGGEVRAARGQHRLAHRLADPRVQRRARSRSRTRRARRRSARGRRRPRSAGCRARRRPPSRAPSAIALAARSTPTAVASGLAAAMPARFAPAPHPSSSTRARARIGRSQPVQRGDRREARRAAPARTGGSRTGSRHRPCVMCSQSFPTRLCSVFRVATECRQSWTYPSTPAWLTWTRRCGPCCAESSSATASKAWRSPSTRRPPTGRPS